MTTVQRVTVETDCTIEITLDTIREAFIDAAENGTQLPRDLLRLMNDVAMIVRAVDNSIIGQLTQQQSAVVVKFLREQADRFELKGQAIKAEIG